jgi:uncharacterized membrane protein HdeD (DUF308 family)
MTSPRIALNSIRGDVARLWWMPLISGIAWIIVAIVVLRFDYTSVAAISVLFGVIALFAAGTETVIAGVSTGGWRWLHLLLAVVFAIAGITAFFQPGGTFVALAAVVSFYLIFRGISDIAIGFSLSGAASGFVGLCADRISRATARFLGRRLVGTQREPARRVGRRCRATSRHRQSFRCLPAPPARVGRALGCEVLVKEVRCAVERRSGLIKQACKTLKHMRDAGGDLEGDLDVVKGGACSKPQRVAQQDLVRSHLNE